MSNFEQYPSDIFKLNCGCLIQDSTGEIRAECVSHESAHFNQ